MTQSQQTAQLLERLRLEGDIDVVVDVSNVCKDRTVGHGWANLPAMLAALARHLGVPRVRALLVVDDSLLKGTGNNPLPPRQRDTLRLIMEECRSLPEGNPFAVVGYADDKILEAAIEHDARVVTNDQLREHYREHAWLKAGSGRFVGWRCTRGRIEIAPRSKIDTGVWTDSRRRQGARISGLPDHARRELFDWWLTCGDPRCRKSGERLGFGDPEGVRWAYSRQAFVCSECGKRATRAGRRPAGCDVYVFWGTDTQVGTYLIVEGESLTVGAGPQAGIDVFREPGGIVNSGDRPTEEQRARVDALHCRIACKGGELTVTDLGSRHGTCVRRMRHSKLVDVDALKPGSAARLVHGDVALLGEAVRLRTSGKRLAHGVPAGAA